MNNFYSWCTSLSKKTFEKVIKSWNNAIIKLKWNQKFLKKNCDKICLKNYELWQNTSFEKSRNKKVTRFVKYFNFEILTDKISTEWEKNIKILIFVRRITSKKNTKTKKFETTIDESYYLSTKKLTAEEYQKIIRWHWWIENQNHYIKDVSMWEDASRIRKNPNIFVVLRSFWLNIMKVFWSKNISIEMFENSLNFQKMIKKYTKFL